MIFGKYIWQYSSDSMTGSISMRHSDRAANDIHEGGIVQSGPYRFSTLLSIIIIWVNIRVNICVDILQYNIWQQYLAPIASAHCCP